MNKVLLQVGNLVGERPIGAGSDAKIGAEMAAFAKGTGIADASDANAVVMDKLAGWLLNLLRAEYRAWKEDTARQAAMQTALGELDNP